MAPSDVIVIGIAGGSGSGKTTLARALCRALGEHRCASLAQDSFYIDQSARFDGDGGRVNFDHPSSLDFALMATQLQALKQAQPIEVPVYDFATHTRRAASIPQPAKPIIIVDGTLILDSPLVRPLFDLSIFVQTSESARYQRRLQRDVRERGRTHDGVRRQFELQVKPMHDQYVEPSLRWASLCVSGEQDLGDELQKAQALIGQRLR